MSDPSETTGIDLSKKPDKSILKRIDIGMTTGLAALLLSFVGIMTSRATFNMNQETQKARVLPIIDVDLGYEKVSVCCVDEGIIIGGTYIKKYYGGYDIDMALMRL